MSFNQVLGLIVAYHLVLVGVEASGFVPWIIGAVGGLF